MHNSKIYELHHRYFLEQVPKIGSLENNVVTKMCMVYQGFNKVSILPKKELTLPCWKKSLVEAFSVNSRILAISFKTDSSSFVFPHWFYKIVLSKISESFLWNFFAIFSLTKLQAFNLQTSLLKITCLSKIYPSKHLLVSKTSWRSLQDMSWKHFEEVVSAAISPLSKTSLRIEWGL